MRDLGLTTSPAIRLRYHRPFLDATDSCVIPTPAHSSSRQQSLASASSFPYRLILMDQTKRMNRRHVMAGLGGAVAAGTGLAGCRNEGESPGGASPSVQTGKRIRWTLASSYPRSLDTIFGLAENLSEKLSGLTGGRFQLEVYSAGELIPGGEVFDAVQQGSIEIGHTAAYYYVGKNPALAFETAVPFGLTARQQTAWLCRGGGLELMNELMADFNIRTLLGGNTGTQMGGWFRREIESLEDLKGLKMRIPGLGGKIMNRLGVNVQVLPGGDIYPALERGAIDATEWVGPYDDQKLGFWQVAKNYYYPGWWEPGANMSIYVNRRSWDRLPSEYQAALEIACERTAADMLHNYDVKNPVALHELVEKGVRLQPFPQDLMKAAAKESEDLHAELSSQEPAYARVFEHWRKFQTASSKWFGTAESAYAQFAFGHSE